MALEKNRIIEISQILDASPELYQEGYPIISPKFGTGNIELLLMVGTFLGRMGKETYDQWKLRKK